MNKTGSGLTHVKDKFIRIREAKIEEGILAQPIDLINNFRCNFDNKLIHTEMVDWNAFKTTR